MSDALKRLEENQDAILLVELGAYLHLLGKLSEEFIEIQSKTGKGVGYKRVLEDNNPIQIPADLFNLLRDNWLKQHLKAKCGINQQEIQGPNNFRKFIEEHVEDNEKWKNREEWLQVMAASHRHASEEEKKEPHSQEKSKQHSKERTWAASAFGFETQPVVNTVDLKNVRNKLCNDLLSHLQEIKDKKEKVEKINWMEICYGKKGNEKETSLLNAFQEAFSKSVGDTQRPINDVTLWDQTYATASYLKSGAAGVIINGWKQPIDSAEPKRPTLKLRILRINIDILELIGKGIRIGDTLGYRKAIEDAFQKAKMLIEVSYPLGNEIYRDTSGIYFSFPDINWTPFKDKLQSELVKVIHDVEWELSPEITVSDESNQDLTILGPQVEKGSKTIGLHRPEVLNPKLNEAWEKPNPRYREACPVCRLRPKKEEKDVCPHCERRRRGRAEDWLKSPRKTIWIDEVADHNDRIALLVGQFDLRSWLNGYLIPTLRKNPSSGRIRRVWKTTLTFWEKTVHEILEAHSYGENAPRQDIIRHTRLIFQVESVNGELPELERGAGYDILLPGITISSVWDGNKFITTDNLQIYPINWGNTPLGTANCLNNKSSQLKVEKQEGGHDIFNVTLRNVDLAPSKFQHYLPFVEIYASPDQFMTLVPAWDAPSILEKIINRYEVEFAKVRDRLPLHLGLVFFHRKTPLYAAIDAGRRFLEGVRKKSSHYTTKVESIEAGDAKEVCEHSKVELGNKVKKLRLSLSDGPFKDRSIEWFMSYSTGDPDMEDAWHPNFILSSHTGGSHETFNLNDGTTCIHVKEVQRDDKVIIRPSLFNFIFLEQAAQRFEVGMDWMLLEDFRRIQKMWLQIKHLANSRVMASSKLHGVWNFLEEKREAWGKESSEWKNLVKATLQNEFELSQKDPGFREFEDAIVDGTFFKCLELHLKILKERLEVE